MGARKIMRPIKGQVVIYAISGCPHCKKAKATLKKLELPYHTINLDGKKEEKATLFAMTDMYTVPQIFFNEVFIGGNSELQNLVKNESQLEQMIEMLESTEAPEGAPDTSAFKQEQTETESEEFDIMDILQSTSDEYKELVRRMQHPQTGLHIADRMYHFKIYKRCFIGHQAVDWLVKNENISRSEAVELGEQLRQKFFFKHVVNDHTFKDKYLFYRFVHHETKKALNIQKLTLKEPKPASEVAKGLRKIILALYDKHLTPDGRGVDYNGIAKSELFSQYEELSYELQRTDIASLPENERKAFFINTYNTLMIHAYVRNGPPRSFWQRFKFFTTNSYMIGGQNYSLDDIEHGILRGNKRSLLGLSNPISNSDPRYAAILPLDPRIHFALVCGAKGCPPIKNYSPQNIDEELDMSAKAFLESGCTIEGNKIYLSKILSWYKNDFGASYQVMLEWISQFLSPQKQAQLSELLSSNSYKISFMPYNWEINAA